MARLPRKTQKIFCSAPNKANQTAVFGTMKTTNKQYSTDVATLQSNAAYTQGWNSATIAGYKPFMEEFNTLNYINTSQLAYLFQQGVAEWDSATTYYKNNFVAKDGLLYVSKTDNNTNHNPATDENNWEVFASGGKGYTPPLFMPQWADHELDNTSFLRADTFSWQDGTTYSLAYNELLAEYNNSDSVSTTEGSITFKRTPKGYKIALSTQETAILNKYNADGIAWYYILDTTNKKFKLPRAKHPSLVTLTSTAPVVGNGKALGYTNGTIEGVWGNTNGWGNGDSRYFCSGLLEKSLPVPVGTSLGFGVSSFPYEHAIGVTTDPTKSGLVADLSSNVKDYNMYLYFYVGGFTKSAEAQTAGLNTELFNNKMDRDMSNRASNIHFVTQTYINGTSWYRLYDDNWCEQGGYITGNGDTSGNTRQQITFIKTFKDVNYYLNGSSMTGGVSHNYIQWCGEEKRTANSVTYYGSVNRYWYACGYIK